MIKNLLILINRNIVLIENYRLKSAFNIKHHFIDYIFAFNEFTQKIFRIYFRLFSVFGYLLNKKVSIRSMDFNLTTECSLKCKECASMMPFYDREHQYTITFDQFKCDLDKLMQGVDKIYRLKLIGGEPLLVNDLDKMLDYTCKKKKVVSVEIITNGTLILSDTLCSVLEKYKHKALVVISDYTENKELKSIKINEIIDKLNAYGASWHISDYRWFEKGDVYKRNRSADEIKKVFENCWQKDCIALMDGKFHTCTRSVAIERLTDYEFLEGEFINIRAESNKELTKKMRQFFVRDYFSVCDFCMSCSDIRLSPAVQTSEVLTIK